MKSISDYREFIEDSKISEIYNKGTQLNNKHIVHINSTQKGGGVAEILKSAIPLMNDTGISVGWRTMLGSPGFFEVTKKFHNALQGEKIDIEESNKSLYEETNQNFSIFTHLHHDLVVIHDPQPLPLINYYNKIQPWLWRCHIDLSDPQESVWRYLRFFLLKYDASIFQLEQFMREDCKDGNYVLRPAIDPLTIKNKDLEEREMNKKLEERGIDPSRPMIAQVSRFDKWKDPSGVLEIYKKIRDMGIDCQLVMVGGMASDDPEGQEVYRQIEEMAEDVEDVNLLVDVPDVMVNVVQRSADVILQMSLREGFGLTVTEALWKETPVISTGVGGISLQLEDGVNGYQVGPEDYDEAAKKTADLLQDEEKRIKMGKAGKEKVKDNFLMPRLVDDWLDIYIERLL